MPSPGENVAGDDPVGIEFGSDNLMPDPVIGETAIVGLFARAWYEYNSISGPML